MTVRGHAGIPASRRKRVENLCLVAWPEIKPHFYGDYALLSLPFPQFPLPTIWLELYQQNRCRCVYVHPRGLTQTHAITVYSLPMVLLHVSHRYLIVRVHYVMQKRWNANKTSSQTTFPFNYGHPGLADCFYTWFKLDLIILALEYCSSVDHKCLSSVCIRCETYCLH